MRTSRLLSVWLPLTCGCRVAATRVSITAGGGCADSQARLQDCFGIKETPRLDEGRRPVLMELLSPGFSRCS